MQLIYLRHCPSSPGSTQTFRPRPGLHVYAPKRSQSSVRPLHPHIARPAVTTGLTPASEVVTQAMAGYAKPVGFSERRGSLLNDDLMLDTVNQGSAPPNDKSGAITHGQQRHMRGPPTPSMSTPAAEFVHESQLGASPPPPPTPAASPGPSNCQPDWREAAENEDFFLAQVRKHFKNCSHQARQRVLADLLNMCTSNQLSFVHQFVSPLLKKDPFTTLPDELCLRVSFQSMPISSPFGRLV